MRWFRFYDDAINDPKILKLSDNLHRVWVGILCAASKNEGKLPSVEDLSLMIRMKPEKLSVALESLANSGLIDNDGVSLSPHNWNGRQYKSDVSTDRVKRFRNGKRNVSETPPETEQIQNTEREDTASAVSPYAFENGVIRLKHSDFEKWTVAFRHLNLRAELLSLTEWAGQQPKWFFAVSSALAKRDREVKAAQERQITKPYKWNGIEGVV